MQKKKEHLDMTVEVVPMPESDDRPINEIPAAERLGVLVKRYRLNARKTVSETAVHMELTPAVIENVEAFRQPLNADQLQALALFLNVRFEPFLDAAADFHRAIWQKNGRTSGFQLAEMSSKTSSVGENAIDLEQAAVDVVWEAARTTQLMREIARQLYTGDDPPPDRDQAIAKTLLSKGDELLVQAKRLQDVLVARGVLQEPPPGTTLAEGDSEENQPQDGAEPPEKG